jgi:hypothetical protein
MNGIKSVFVGLAVLIVTSLTIILLILGQVSMYLLAPLVLAIVGGVAYYDMKNDGTL